MMMKNGIVATALFCNIAFALAGDFQETYNTLSSQANVATKISLCMEKGKELMCETFGTRTDGYIVIAKNINDGKKQYTFFTASKNSPTAGDFQAWADAYSILVLLTDSSLSTEKVNKMISDMMSQGIKTNKEIVKKVKGHVYSFNFANLGSLGVGEGYMLTYTAR